MSARGLVAGLVVAFALTAGSTANAQPRHGLSVFGTLKYPATFSNFDYAEPNAPKGGRLSMIGTSGVTTFNSFNGFIYKGQAAQGLSFLFDTLMTPAQDEPSAAYGLVARLVDVAADRSSVTFYLRKEARFADGSALTAADVVRSFELLKEKGHPSFRISLRDVVRATALDDYTVRYDFTGPRTRDLPLTVATLPIFSKAYYETRKFDETTLDPPLGSGPYEIAKFKQGRFVQYRRRDDYWARDLAVNRGRFNFDELRYEYFRDRVAEFEGLKAGVFDLREEFTSKTWATEYTFAAVTDGRVIRETLADGTPSGAQGFYINLRRRKFSDIRVRKALDLAFDFEWTNKFQFHGLYKRTHSAFENSPMKAVGPPSPGERALLEPFRAQLPPDVFAAPYRPPVSDGSGQDRKLLREASRLLSAAGYKISNGRRIGPDGTALTLEFLIFSPTFERVIAPFIRNLELLGIAATIRRVDPAQYQERVKQFDLDITTQRNIMRMTPGVELRNYWGSASAGINGSLNLAGIKDPVIDALIEKVIGARSRQQLTIAARALDRVLRAKHYWVPHWYKASHTIAYWNKFSRPRIKPKYSRGIIDLWWYDKIKAERLNKR